MGAAVETVDEDVEAGGGGDGGVDEGGVDCVDGGGVVGY